MCGNWKPFAFRSALCPLLFLGIASLAQAELPDGPGKAALLRLCSKCHSPEQAVSMRQSSEDWEDTMAKMVKLGATGTDDFDADSGVLVKELRYRDKRSINVNKATAVDLEICWVWAAARPWRSFIIDRTKETSRRLRICGTCPDLISRRLRQRRTGWRFESLSRSVESQMTAPSRSRLGRLCSNTNGFAGRLQENEGPAGAVDMLGRDLRTV